MSARQDALDKLDNAKFGWFHIKACIVSGIGFYTDAYDLFIIGLATNMIGFVYFPDNENKVPPNQDTALKMSALVGTLIGQLVFGYLADLLGRKKMYGAELIMIVFFTITQCFAANTVQGINVITMLIIWRFCLGFGIGGDYPLSAIITSEFANTKNRGAMIAAVFAMQGFGILTGCLTSLIVLASFKDMVNENPQNLDYVWRIIIGLGALPGLCAIYFRLTIPETPRYTMEIKGDVEKAQKDVDGIFKKSVVNDSSGQSGESNQQKPTKPTLGQFYHHIKKWRHLKVLLGTAVSWFALDVAFYGLNLNQPVILEAIGFSSKGTPYEKIYNNIVGSLIIALLGSVPGYWITVFTIDILGRKFIQIMGFIALAVLYLVIGIFYDSLLEFSVGLFIVIYTMANLFTNFGPNSTTFIIPGEVFPTKYRSTCHGISAAAGKLGAIISQGGFLKMKDIGGKDKFIPDLFIILSIFMVIGLVFTFFIPETKGKSLEQIERDCELNSSAVKLLG